MFNRLCEYVGNTVALIVGDRGSPCECKWKIATIGREAIIWIDSEEIVLHYLMRQLSKSLKSATGYHLTKRYQVSTEIVDRNTVAVWKSDDGDLYIHDLYLDRVPLTVVCNDWDSFATFHKTSIIDVETDGVLHVHRV